MTEAERGSIGHSIGPTTSDVSDDVIDSPSVRTWDVWVWAAAMVAIAGFTAVHLGAFDLFTSVRDVGGGVDRIPNTFASVDHPFHAARAFTLLQSIHDGEILRWVGNHQGGYPVEFYPLGVAWLEVGVWGLLLGSLPILAVHKLVVIFIFLLPGLGYWLLARRDRVSYAVPLAAFLVHIAVPGGWVHGGWKELVVWGLVTNVAAAVALLFVLWALSTFLHDGAWPIGAAAAAGAAFALGTNPRSAIGLGIVGIGCWIAAVEVRSATWRQITARLLVVAGVAGALAAPILIPLLRFSDLYFFVRYSRYESVGFYVGKIVTSVSPPVAILAVIGVVLGLFVADRPVTRAAAVSLTLYVLVTAILATDARDSDILEQLEATRLMPFQRLVTIYLGAVAAEALLRWALPRRADLRDGLLATGAVVLFVVYVRPIGPVPNDDHGLMDVGEAARLGSPTMLTTGNSVQAEFLTAVREADTAVSGDGAMLILGTALGWHQQLWAPTETDRPLFYNDFLWYWHAFHAGPYNYLQGNAYPPGNVGRTLDESYLADHGIAVVIVTSDAFKDEAATAPTLELISRGIYDVYRVREVVPIVSFPGGETAEFTITNQEITASGTSTGGNARIARNWHPRWEAEVNGDQVPVTRTEDGYMSAPVPAGVVDLVVIYEVDAWDWIGRGLALVGGFGAVGMVGYVGAGRWRRDSVSAPS